MAQTKEKTQGKSGISSYSDLEKMALNHMAERNFILNEPLDISGKTIKFSGRTGIKEKTEWYKASQQIENGIIGLQVTYNSHHISLKSEKNNVFSSRTDNQISEAERKEQLERVTKHQNKRAKQEAAEEGGRKKQAIKDRQRFEKAEVQGTSPYLDRKAVQAHGARFEKKLINGKEETILLIPMPDINREIQSLQEIYPYKRIFNNEKKPRDKNFTNAVRGLFHVIGEIKDGQPIRISEGFATAASVFKCTNFSIPHVVAFSVGAYQHIIPILKKLYPNSPITICADNNIHDDPNEVNTGLEEAKKASKQFNCSIQYPIFPNDKNKAADGKYYCDYNDLMLVMGAAEVQKQVSKKHNQNEELIISHKTPLNSAERLIEDKFKWDNIKTIHFCGDAFWIWNGRCYEEVTINNIRQSIYEFLSRAKTQGTEGTLNNFDPNKGKVDHLLDAFKAINDCKHQPEAGATWVGGQAFLSVDNLIVFSNGILDIRSWIEKKNTELIKHTPLLINSGYLPFDFCSQYQEPKEWLNFLNSVWPNDQDSINTLQEFFGYYLTQDTRHHKILLLVGPPRSGKGTIARILRAMLGERNVVGPTLSSLAGPFGLQPWLNKALAVISDARISGKSDHGIITERLLSISGEDPLTIDRKHRDPITVKLPTRIMIMTNELPNLSDSSSALANRYIILSMLNSWIGKEDPELENRIRPELSNIILWALEGLMRLRLRNRFIQPKSASQHIDELMAMTSPVKLFVNERCEIDQTKWIEINALFKVWCDWCNETGQTSGTIHVFGRDLRAAYPQIISQNRRDKDEASRSIDKRTRFYIGIGLSILPK
jgi:putative DNA primase/helicase